MKRVTLTFILLAAMLALWATTNQHVQGSINASNGQEVTPPDGIEQHTYTLTAQSMFWGEAEDYSADVQVAFDGTDVYIQGLSNWLPDAWVKGQLKDNGSTIMFPSAYLGSKLVYGEIEMEFTFNGATFQYDADAGTLTSAEGYTTTSVYDLYGDTQEEDGDVLINVVITKAVEVAATPAAPQIQKFFYNDPYGYELNLNIPLEDVDGNTIFASKLSYQIFKRKDGVESPLVLKAEKYEYAQQDLSIIPYLYTDNWEVTKGGETVFIYEDDIEAWDAIGVKTIYTAAGQTNESSITWKNNDWSTSNSISTATDNANGKCVVRFDVSGCRVLTQPKGIVIEQTRQPGGSKITRKIMMK